MRLTPVRIVASLAAVFSLGLACAPLIAQDQTTPDAATAADGPRSSEEVYSDLELFGQVFDRIRA